MERTNKQSKDDVVIIKRIEDFFFLREEDRKDITDSLLLDSGQIVLSGTIDGFHAYVVVCGDVRVIWKGQIYKAASQFPSELADAIRNGSVSSSSDENYVTMNNWYETRLEKDDKQLEDDIIDMDLSDMTEEDARSLLFDIVAGYKESHNGTI